MKIAVIVLSLDEQTEAQNTIRSLQNQKNIPEAYQLEVQLMQSRSEEFDTMAQMKNAALQKTNAEAVVFVMAGEVWEEDRLCRLLCAPAWSDVQLIWYLATHDDADFTAFVLEKQQLCSTGVFHAGLAAGEDYELLLRMAMAGMAVRILNDEPAYEKAVSYELFSTYAYVIGKYSEELKAAQLFEAVVAKRLEQAGGYGIQEMFLEELKCMVSRQEAFWKRDCQIEPILVLTGDPVCYGVLLDFAGNFCKELLAQGQLIELFDISSEPLSGISRYIGRHFKAVVGFQTGIFTAVDKISNSLIMDMIYGRKFEFVYDHPLYLDYHISKLPKNTYLLMQDADYADYAKKYYPDIADACQLPPAGQQTVQQAGRQAGQHAGQQTGRHAGQQTIQMEATDYVGLLRGFSKRSYEISFIGSYFDYRERMLKIKELTGETKHRALRLLQRMKQNPNQPIEALFEQQLASEHKEYDACWFREELSRMQAAGHTIKAYYREKVIQTMLDAGITIHVFGDGWNSCKLKSNPCLILHPTVGVEDSLAVMADSKMSLNVMSWHKAGMTERIANVMMNGAVCLSDQTSYLNEHFADGTNIVLFNLEHLEALPKRVKTLLADEKRLEQIARAGYEEANLNHSWCSRVTDFLKLLEAEQCSG